MRARRSSVLRGMSARLLLPFLVVLAACGARAAPPADVIPIARVSAPPLAVEPGPDAGPKEKPACLSEDSRSYHLMAAWPEKERVFFCLELEGPDENGSPETRACTSVGPHGDYRLEALREGRPPPLPETPFRKESADGKLSFRLEGGLREPKKATGILEQKSPKKVLKRAPIAYDEHVSFEGFIGQGIVLKTWVDEGPGCSLSLVDPKKTWPSGIDMPGAVALGGCYAGIHALRTRPNEIAVIDSGGSSIVFVNEDTLEETDLDLERQGGPEMGAPFIAWLEGRTLVMVYGAPVAGDVLRVSLDRREVTATSEPPTCVKRARPGP